MILDTEHCKIRTQVGARLTKWSCLQMCVLRSCVFSITFNRFQYQSPTAVATTRNADIVASTASITDTVQNLRK